MLPSVPTRECAQAREAASARLDGELSELDLVRLDVHLRACADCRRYSDEIQTITSGLRASSLEQPRSRILLPKRRRVPVQAAAAAAIVLAAVTGSSFALGKALRTDSQHVKTVTAARANGLNADVAQEHLLAMLHRFAPAPAQHQGAVQAI